MNAIENKNLIKSFFQEVYNEKRVEIVSKIFSEDYFEHRDDGARSNQDAIDILKGAFTIFPDIHCDIKDIVSEEDNVFVRVAFTATHKGEFIGIMPTEKTITFEAMEQFKIENSKITESWGSWPLFDIIDKLN